MRRSRLFAFITIGIVGVIAAPILVLYGVAWWLMRQFTSDLEVAKTRMTIKLIATRYHWRYHCATADGGGFDLDPGPSPCKAGTCEHALDADHAAVVPVGTLVHLEVTADAGTGPRSPLIQTDGVRVAATSRRVQESWLRVEREGVYVGSQAPCGERVALRGLFAAVTPSLSADRLLRQTARR